MEQRPADPGLCSWVCLPRLSQRPMVWELERTGQSQSTVGLDIGPSRCHTARMPLPTLTLDPADDLPLYRQLGDALAGAIADGVLDEGERLPSERDLAASPGGSRDRKRVVEGKRVDLGGGR